MSSIQEKTHQLKPLIERAKSSGKDAWIAGKIFYCHKIQLDFATIARESGRVGF